MGKEIALLKEKLQKKAEKVVSDLLTLFKEHESTSKPT